MLEAILRIVVIMCGAGAFWFYRVHLQRVPSCCRGVAVDPSTPMEQSSTQKDNLINYNIIDNLPFGYDFSKHSIKELRQYRTWFFDTKQSRLDELNALICRTPGYADWKMDYSEESLFQLGEFLKHVVEIRPLSPEVYKQRRESTSYYIDVSDWELTPRTISILIDLGMYVGDVLIKNHPGLKWIQYPGRGKIDANYGHMVILINTNNWVNPTRAMYITGLKVAKGTFTQEWFINSYNFWSDSVDVNMIN